MPVTMAQSAKEHDGPAKSKSKPKAATSGDGDNGFTGVSMYAKGMDVDTVKPGGEVLPPDLPTIDVIETKRLGHCRAARHHRRRGHEFRCCKLRIAPRGGMGSGHLVREGP